MSYSLKVLIVVIGWSILFALIRPLALLALILLAVVWLVPLPLRFVARALQATAAWMRAVWLLLPGRLRFKKSNA